MTNETKMLKIDHIEPVGLIAEDGADLAKVFCNTYLINAANQIIEQNPAQVIHFMGGVAGHALSHVFNRIDLKQLNSVLAQIRSFIIQNQGH